MTLKVEDRASVIKTLLVKAIARLEKAKKYLTDDPGISSRMSYESAYFSTTAILIGYGMEIPNTHEGVNYSLHKNFVQGEGIFPVKIAAYLGDLEKDRNVDQYSIYESVSNEKAQINLEKAEKFLATSIPIAENRLSHLDSLSPESPVNLENMVKNLHLLPDNPNIYSNPSRLVNYRGPILHVDMEQGFSVQQTGKATLVIHKHDAIERIPEKGENLQINYKPGLEKAEMKTLQHSKSNGRKPGL